MTRDDAYDLIDRFLRNMCDDNLYAEYSEALDLCFTDESLRQQLAAALAACALKDEALKLIALDDCCTDPAPIAQKALSIQPDDSALKAWLGEPITKVIHYDEVGMPHTIYLNKPLYSPKGLVEK